jgi:hypothetical protein
MLLPIQYPPLVRVSNVTKISNQMTVSTSQNRIMDSGSAIRCQICCENSIGKSDRCKSEDNPYCICTSDLAD